MTRAAELFQGPSWEIITVLAEMLNSGITYEEMGDDNIRELLLANDFAADQIDVTLDWLENAAKTASIADIISMVSSHDHHPQRVVNPLENASISSQLWSRFNLLRSRGFLSDDTAERVLEGLRSIDTRDWEGEDISVFLSEILQHSLPHASEQTVIKILRNEPTPELYS